MSGDRCERLLVGVRDHERFPDRHDLRDRVHEGHSFDRVNIATKRSTSVPARRSLHRGTDATVSRGIVVLKGRDGVFLLGRPRG